MIYIVTGFTRSGTSMMMNCLIAGGMDAEYTEGNIAPVYYEAKDGYHPNEQGYRQLDEKDIKKPGFPECYDNKLIKMPMYWWTGTRGYGNRTIRKPFRVIFMRRDWEEQRLSRRLLDDHISKREDGNLITSREPIYEEVYPRIKEQAKTYHEIWYAAVIKDPLVIFKQLQKEGWPIIPKLAATIPNPKYRHVNLEDNCGN